MEALTHVLSLVETFRAFDSDNDGFITSPELGGLMASLGYDPTEQEIKTMMQQGDTDKDGELSMMEFLDMNTRHLELEDHLASCLEAALEAMDSQGLDDGQQLAKGQALFAVLSNMGVHGMCLEDCQNIVTSIDSDGDGTITFEDFKIIVNSLI